METGVSHAGHAGIDSNWATLYLGTVGFAAGFLGSLAKLGSNMLGAWIVNLDDPLKLLRVYATVGEGSRALASNSGISLMDTFLLHGLIGSVLGAAFILIMSKLKQSPSFARFLLSGAIFGLLIWVVNFYLLLSWIQPLLNGRAYIVETIPWWVASGTHVVYGLTVALVAFPFRNDIHQ